MTTDNTTQDRSGRRRRAALLIALAAASSVTGVVLAAVLYGNTSQTFTRGDPTEIVVTASPTDGTTDEPVVLEFEEVPVDVPEQVIAGGSSGGSTGSGSSGSGGSSGGSSGSGSGSGSSGSSSGAGSGSGSGSGGGSEPAPYSGPCYSGMPADLWAQCTAGYVKPTLVFSGVSNCYPTDASRTVWMVTYNYTLVGGNHRNKTSYTSVFRSNADLSTTSVSGVPSLVVSMSSMNGWDGEIDEVIYNAGERIDMRPYCK